MEFEQTQIEVEEPENAEKKTKKVQLGVRVSEELEAYAKEEAKRLGLSKEAVVEAALLDHKAKNTSELYPDMASDKDAFDTHLRQITELYTGVIAKYSTLREDIEAQLKAEMDKRQKTIDSQKEEIKELIVRAEKAEAEAKETSALRETIEAKDATIADKDAIIAANANLSTRLDEALAKADAADKAERELQGTLQATEKRLEVAQSRIELISKQAEKDKEDAEKRLEAARIEADARITAIKAENEAALRAAEIKASEQLEKAEATSDKRLKEAKAEAEARISKLEADLDAKDSRIAELYEKIAELSRA